MKEKKKKIIILSIAIVAVIAIITGSTYAYWQITKTQTTPNDIVAACLDLNLEDKSAAIDLDSAWPISDDEASSLTGYTFTVTNNCDEEINYIVGLNRVEESNYLLDSSIKLQLDENSSHVYGELSDVEYSDAENTEYIARVSKQVSVETIGANGTNTHTIRVWINDEAPVTEQSKTFLGQVFITGGQGIKVPECFTIANDGTLLGYDESCGLDVKVPAEINGIKVKTINLASFQEFEALLSVGYIEETGIEELIIVILDIDKKDKILNFLKETICSDPTTCNLEDVGVTAVLDGVEGYNQYDFNQYDSIAVAGGVLYDETNDKMIVAFGDFQTGPNINTLDLSETIYLSEIQDYSVANQGFYSKIINESCTYNVEYSLYECDYGNLESLILPENGILSYIGHGAFEGNVLQTIKIPASVETINDDAFRSNLLSTLTFEDTSETPSKITELVEDSFSYNDLTKVVLPSSIATIERHVFAGNPNLTEVIIKNTEGNVTVSDTAFPTATNVTYNPNYTE